MRALIVAPNISARMGGEAILPYHYIRELAGLGVELHALTHARVRDEIASSAINTLATFHYVEDAFSERMLYRFGRRMPGAVEETVFNTAIGAVTLNRLARQARRLEREITFDVIHQPTPVSPLFPSFLSGMTAPVIIGPMNGGMEFPPAFKNEYAQGSSLAISIGRTVAGAANFFFPGKRQAAALLVANDRTEGSLPYGVNPDRVKILVENGVDLDLWTPGAVEKSPQPQFVFVGRLVWWKAIDLLIEAFAASTLPGKLLIVGDGPERKKLEGIAQKLAPSRVEFAGFRPQAEIRDILARSTALILPSMRECGGAVILEAFACGTPAIATNWGGPRDYITPGTGLLIEPSGREVFIRELKNALEDFAANPQKAAEMGKAARAEIEAHYSWRAKAEAMLGIYKAVAAGAKKDL